jgi:hypothetical protein
MFIFPLFFAAILIPNQDEVNQLVRQLDSGRLIERDQTERQLRELGPEIETFLPNSQELEEEYSVEVQLRLRNVRRFFQQTTLKKALEQVHFSVEEKSWADDPDRLFLTLNVDWRELRQTFAVNFCS